MRPAAIVMCGPFPNRAAQVAFVDREDEVQALAPNRAHQSFTEGIRLRSPNWRFEHAKSATLHHLIDLSREDGVAVMNQKLVGMIECEHFAELLDRPLRGGMGRDVGVDDAARADLHGDKNVEDPEIQRDRLEEIAGNDGRGMVAYER